MKVREFKTRRRRPTLRWLALTCLLSAAQALHAADVYRSVDAQGAVSYSDVPTPGATPVQVDPATPSAGLSRQDMLAEQQRIIDQQLAVADSLEASRLAREAARTRRLEALAATRTVAPAPPPAEPEVRYVSSYGYRQGGRYPGHPSFPWRPGSPGYPAHPGKPGYPVRPAHPAQPIAPPPPTSPTSFPVRFPYSDR